MSNFNARRFSRRPVAGGILFLFIAALAHFAAAQNSRTGGKSPVIVIPGLVGSELINERTGEVVWFKVARSSNDDLRLPISGSLTENRDALVPHDILRSARIGLLKPIDVYGGLINALKTRGGYREGDWENPPPRGDQDTFYVYAYDWRRDNVENARRLVTKLDDLKRRLNRPNLKFNVVAHSMGGLIARYAAMYGDEDLPNGASAPVAPWAGAQHFKRIFLVGTPNDGAALALKSLVKGFEFGTININLPFVQNLSKYDLFTVPSVFQLLPQTGTERLFDENLRPLNIDLYDPKTWETYGWSVAGKKNFARQFNAAEQSNARLYLKSVLERARRFQTALNADFGGASPISFYAVGSDCRETLDGAVLYRTRAGWKTHFSAEAFRRSDGKIVSSSDLRRLIFAQGDGIVSRRSLKSERSAPNETQLISPERSEYFRCEGHNKLVANAAIQNKILQILAAN